MADYWKSNPRKFCDFCKCWFADNKSSKQFHESGKRHKENVEKKIGELRKKGQKQYETQQEMSGFLKQMEEGAMKAFKQDVESNPDLIPEYRVAVVENIVKQQQEHPSALSGSRYQPGQSGGGSGTQGTTPSSSSPTPSNPAQEEWVEAVSPEGHTYYWNTKRGATQWEKPANFTPLKSSSSSKNNSSSNKKVAEKSDSSDESAEEEEKERKEPRGTKRTADAYGGWTTISAEPEEEPDLQLPEANPLYMSSYVPQAVQYEPREKLNIQEKKVGSIQASPREASGSVSFKKRKGGQRQIRSRDATS